MRTLLRICAGYYTLLDFDKQTHSSRNELTPLLSALRNRSDFGMCVKLARVPSDASLHYFAWRGLGEKVLAECDARRVARSCLPMFTLLAFSWRFCSGARGRRGDCNTVAVERD